MRAIIAEAKEVDAEWLHGRSRLPQSRYPASKPSHQQIAPPANARMRSGVMAGSSPATAVRPPVVPRSSARASVARRPSPARLNRGAGRFVAARCAAPHGRPADRPDPPAMRADRARRRDGSRAPRFPLSAVPRRPVAGLGDPLPPSASVQPAHRDDVRPKEIGDHCILPTAAICIRHPALAAHTSVGR